jgi:hypothetical protein
LCAAGVHDGVRYELCQSQHCTPSLLSVGWGGGSVQASFHCKSYQSDYRPAVMQRRWWPKPWHSWKQWPSVNYIRRCQILCCYRVGRPGLLSEHWSKQSVRMQRYSWGLCQPRMLNFGQSSSEFQCRIENLYSVLPQLTQMQQYVLVTVLYSITCHQQCQFRYPMCRRVLGAAKLPATGDSRNKNSLTVYPEWPLEISRQTYKQQFDKCPGVPPEPKQQMLPVSQCLSHATAAHTACAHRMATEVSCCVSVGGSATAMGMLAANRL